MFAPGNIGAGFIGFSGGLIAIPNLQVWYEADFVGNVLNGGTVSQVTDRSGKGFHASQPTAGNQATLTASALNGLSVLTFDGSTDFYPLPSQALNMAKGVGGITIALVVKSATTTGTINVFTITNNSTGTRFGLLRAVNRWQVAARQDDAGSAAVLSATNTLSTSNWYSIIASVNYATDEFKLQQNNDALQTSATGFGGASTCSNTTSGSITFGAGTQTPSLLFSGSLGMVAIWSRAINTTEWAKVRQYQNRYALGLT